MAQFGQTQMSKQHTSYLDVMKQKEEEKPKFNLFDFSSTKTQQPTQTKQMNFGAPMSGKNITNFSDYKQTIPQQTQPTQKSGFSLIPTANADFGQEDIATFRDLVDKGIEPERAKNLIIKSKEAQDINDMGLLQEGGQRLSNLGTKLGERAGKFGEAFTKERSQNPFIAGTQNIGASIGAVGQIAGGIGDIAFEGLAYVTPDIVKETLIGGAKKAWENTPEIVKQTAINAIKVGGEEYKQFKQNNPFLADTLEGSLNIASLAPIRYGGKVAGKGIEKTGEVLTKGGKQVLKGVEKGKTLIQPTLRATEDISANILQPYKGMTENLADANKGLQRVVQETGTKVDDFENLLKNTTTTKERYGKILDESLNNVSGQKFSESADTALSQLGELYKGTQSQASKDILKRINELGMKNQQVGLTAKEMQEVKVLHTKANNLFNEKGQATGGFLADDLRNVRNELKTDIEDFASSQGITNIKDINQVYGELLDTEGLLKNQIANVKAFKGRALPETITQKIGSLIGKIPLIKGGVQGIFKEAGISLKAGKIDPLEVQKRLPNLLKELQKAGVKEGELKKIETQIRTFITPPPKPRLLLPEGRSNLKPNQPTNATLNKPTKK